MEDKLILTPEQLFFLGTVMHAEYINYDYIAALEEVQRNYSRTHRKCMDELSRAGLLRERLSGEVALRPVPKKLLNPVFFGKKESSLEIFKLGKNQTHDIFRFHWSEDAVTQVRQTEDRLVLSTGSAERIEALVEDRVRGAERPMHMDELLEKFVTGVLTVKRAAVGEGSTGTVLFEQFGGWYSIDDSGRLQGVPASRARAMILAELKGECFQ